ncbi:MAG TPA: hypothetical protein PK624_11505 [Spirochaetota bacterium]|nr:hypothetical protein [Spirochaetota bacterium]HPK57115.1 hypothetical protein [Spirochaetota bacterium]
MKLLNIFTVLAIFLFTCCLTATNDNIPKDQVSKIEIIYYPVPSLKKTPLKMVYSKNSGEATIITRIINKSRFVPLSKVPKTAIAEGHYVITTVYETENRKDVFEVSMPNYFYCKSKNKYLCSETTEELLFLMREILFGELQKKGIRFEK